MSTDSSIEWTDATWNPVVGCTRVSAGCDHCYAVSMTRRLEGMAKAPGSSGRKQLYAGLTVLNPRGDRHFNGVVRCVEEAIEVPLRWKQPRRIFVNSMSDLFHERVPFEFIDRVFAVMALCSQHTFQVLTKRPERMAEYLTRPETRQKWAEAVAAIKPLGFRDQETDAAAYRTAIGDMIDNVWLGTSCENQAAADERVPHLMRCPAAVRFLSCEPLLGPIDLDECGATPCDVVGCPDDIAPAHNHDGVDWIIVGGESGPKARTCRVEWIAAIVEQSRVAGVPCFVKQLGAEPSVSHPTDPREPSFYRNGGFLAPWVPDWAASWIRKFDRKGADPSEWPPHLRVREWPSQNHAGGVR